MNTIEVCLTHELIHQHELEGKVVVITDVFRATSCIVAGLATGVKAIKPLIEVEDCRTLQAEGWLAGGERHAQLIEGFDLDNSPFSYMEERAKGKKVAMTTTNGTLAVNKSMAADEILAASFGNLTATVSYLKTLQKDVIVLAAGWKGRPGLEDVLFAGALALGCQEFLQTVGDSTHLAIAGYDVAKGNLLEYMQRASHLHRLKNLSGGKDIPFCLEIDQFDVVVKLNEAKELVAL
ncbi:2-phosphosulfolactate phosphatase [Jiulongibacter sp. NS-SX5]|uniref:2-phosphosulfolactate phosphatase n=1 Tax=Jiulongibacter sp. NS-SX5 TaxID=3463854 RepID=UPI004059CCD2